ncbi:MAG: Crp/Fnr family transcriptional regulator [Porphyrobacter sp.]|nr:Crp/Fnr family transcriptional regulator [Porphyrobacter sp.]
MGLNCSTCPVKDRAACSVLTDGEREALARSGRGRKLKRGEVLFAAGDENSACATLLKGALKVTSVDEQGTERILAIVHPSGFIGELFAPFAHHDVIALTDSELCVFPRSEMGRAIDLNPKLSQALLRRSQEDLLQSRELLSLSGRRSAPSKVAGLMMGIAEGASDSSCHAAREFELPLTRGEIAGMLGLTIETVSRALTKFERDGVIRRKGARGIELLDPARLGWVAEGAEG